MHFPSFHGGGGVTLDPSSLVLDIPQLLVAMSLCRESELLYWAQGQVRVRILEHNSFISVPFVWV